jgi:chromosome segregation ATPase
MMRSSVSTAALWAAIIAVLAAVGGWGAFFLVSERAVATEQAQLRELRELRAHKAELVKVVHDQQAKTAELAELDRKLRGLQENLDRTREAQERAQGALGAAQNEVSARRAELTTLGQQIAQTREEQARAEQKAAEQTASIEKATPSPRKKRYLRKAKRGKRNGRA